MASKRVRQVCWRLTIMIRDLSSEEQLCGVNPKLDNPMPSPCNVKCKQHRPAGRAWRVNAMPHSVLRGSSSDMSMARAYLQTYRSKVLVTWTDCEKIDFTSDTSTPWQSRNTRTHTHAHTHAHTHTWCSRRFRRCWFFPFWPLNWQFRHTKRFCLSNLRPKDDVTRANLTPFCIGLRCRGCGTWWQPAGNTQVCHHCARAGSWALR